MRDIEQVKRDIYEMLEEYVATSETLAYCNDCTDLRWCNDTGTYDCPYGLDCTCCEKSCTDKIEDFAEKFIDMIQMYMP